MATVTISDEARATAEQLVHDGRFASVEEAFEAGMHRLKGEIDSDDFVLSPEEIAAVDASLADIEAGRIYSADEVFAELRARFPGR